MLERFGCLGIILVALVVIFGVAMLLPPRPPPSGKQPTWADYEACIADEIARCVTDGVQRDLMRSRAELPVMPSRTERESRCRAVIIETDRLYREGAICRAPSTSN